MQTPPSSPHVSLDSLFDMVVNGGPMMVPLGLCSIVALAYIVERSVRLGRRTLGGPRFAAELRDAAAERGAAGALECCLRSRTAMARVLGAGLRRWDGPFLEREKAMEDAGALEVRHLSANLRPLVVVAMIAPLIGLLGTVWGMIEAFSTIALRDGLGKPEMLASGISQALITTATGLAIAIPSQCAYFYFKARLDRFVRQAEDLAHDVCDDLEAAATETEAAA